MTREMYKVVRYFDTYPEKIIESNVEYEYAKKMASVLKNRNKKPHVTYEILKELWQEKKQERGGFITNGNNFRRRIFKGSLRR